MHCSQLILIVANFLLYNMMRNIIGSATLFVHDYNAVTALTYQRHSDVKLTREVFTCIDRFELSDITSESG